MNRIPLPGLRNDEPLGFLAALGLTCVLELGGGLTPKLGWAGVGQEAVLVVDDAWDLDRVVMTLNEFVCRLDENHLVHPAITGFPLVKHGVSGSDPMFMSFDRAVALATEAAKHELGGWPEWGRWLAGTVNQCAHRIRKSQGRAQMLTPLYAAARQQTFARNLRLALDELKSDPGHLRAALTSWRRIDGFAGANLDYRAERNAATTQDSTVKNQGVPGATWLALMSIPQLRLVGDGTTGGSTLFQRPGREREVMVWPLWQRPLGPRAVQTLIEHPALRLQRTPAGLAVFGDRTVFAALGVDAVAWAKRSSLEKSGGPIGPAIIIGLR